MVASVNVKIAIVDLARIEEAVSRGEVMSKSDFIRRAIIAKLAEDKTNNESQKTTAQRVFQ